MGKQAVNKFSQLQLMSFGKFVAENKFDEVNLDTISKWMEAKAVSGTVKCNACNQEFDAWVIDDVPTSVECTHCACDFTIIGSNGIS